MSRFIYSSFFLQVVGHKDFLEVHTNFEKFSFVKVGRWGKCSKSTRKFNFVFAICFEIIQSIKISKNQSIYQQFCHYLVLKQINEEIEKMFMMAYMKNLAFLILS